MRTFASFLHYTTQVVSGGEFSSFFCLIRPLCYCLSTMTTFCELMATLWVFSHGGFHFLVCSTWCLTLPEISGWPGKVTDHSLPRPHWPSLWDRKLFPFPDCLKLPCITVTFSWGDMVRSMVSAANRDAPPDKPFKKELVAPLQEKRLADSLRLLLGLPLLSSHPTPPGGGPRQWLDRLPGTGKGPFCGQSLCQSSLLVWGHVPAQPQGEGLPSQSSLLLTSQVSDLHDSLKAVTVNTYFLSTLPLMIINHNKSLALEPYLSIWLLEDPTFSPHQQGHDGEQMRMNTTNKKADKKPTGF